MFYQFIHPYTKHKTVFDTKNEADIFLQQSINELKSYTMSTKLKEEFANDIAVAKNYLHSKNIDNDIVYDHSIYNETTKEYLGKVYFSVLSHNQWVFIKVKDGDVKEFYKINIFDDYYEAYSVDTTTLEKKEIYKYLYSNLNPINFAEAGYNFQSLLNMSPCLGKYDLNNNLIAVTHFVSGFDSLPEDKKISLMNWEYKNKIIHIKQQTYGYIIHFVDNIHKQMGQDELEKYALNQGFYITQVF